MVVCSITRADFRLSCKTASCLKSDDRSITIPFLFLIKYRENKLEKKMIVFSNLVRDQF